MTRIGLGLAILAMLSLGDPIEASAQSFEIGIVDFYGLNKVSAGDARAALTFKEGDTITLAASNRPAAFASSEDRLTKLPGVVGARVNVVCCDAGRAIVYVGVQEDGARRLRLRRPPRGTARLPADVVYAGEEFSKASMAAVERGDAGEDHSQGHALAHDPATRAIQAQFVVFARRDVSLLRVFLRDSADARHRALAAQVLGYAPDKQAVVDDPSSARFWPVIRPALKSGS